MRIPRRALVVAACGVLAGCAAPTPAPATPPVLVTQPFYEPVLVDWASTYRRGLSGPLPFDLDTRTRTEGIGLVKQDEAQLLVTTGEPPQGWFATPLGNLGLAVVVHSQNPVRDLNTDELRDLFSGAADSWDDVGGPSLSVQPVLPLPGEPAGDAFASLVMGDRAPWPGTLLAPTTSAMAQMVADDPGAIGILPAAAVPQGLRIMPVEGVLPGGSTVASGAYPLSVPLLATAPTEPTGALRDFLIWIQSQAAKQ